MHLKLFSKPLMIRIIENSNFRGVQAADDHHDRNSVMVRTLGPSRVDAYVCGCIVTVLT